MRGERGTPFNELEGLRDRAILSVGLQVGLRRAEIAGLAVEDLHQNRAASTRCASSGRAADATRLPSTRMSRNAFAPILGPPAMGTIWTGPYSDR
jgi:hypothetical protein